MQTPLIQFREVRFTCFARRCSCFHGWLPVAARTADPILGNPILGDPILGDLVNESLRIEGKLARVHLGTAFGRSNWLRRNACHRPRGLPLQLSPSMQSRQNRLQSDVSNVTMFLYKNPRTSTRPLHLFIAMDTLLIHSITNTNKKI